MPGSTRWHCRCTHVGTSSRARGVRAARSACPAANRRDFTPVRRIGPAGRSLAPPQHWVEISTSAPLAVTSRRQGGEAASRWRSRSDRVPAGADRTQAPADRAKGLTNERRCLGHGLRDHLAGAAAAVDAELPAVSTHVTPGRVRGRDPRRRRGRRGPGGVAHSASESPVLRDATAWIGARSLAQLGPSRRRGPRHPRGAETLALGILGKRAPVARPWCWWRHPIRSWSASTSAGSPRAETVRLGRGASSEAARSALGNESE
jgi:hypothetical protein